MSPNSPLPDQQTLQSCDPVWAALRDEATEAVENEPALSGFIYKTVLSHHRLEEAVTYRLSQRLKDSDVDQALIQQAFEDVLEEAPELGPIFRADLAAVLSRDPACHRHLEPLLYYKGFQALETHRFAHELWKMGRRDFALYLQSQASKVFSIDIHPAAKIGQGIMFDHGTGIVIGETSEIGDNSSILHGVTLGGTGNEEADRHPKIGSNVLVGAGAKILGNITVGCCARVASGSVVLKDVPHDMTVAGVPAKVVGPAGCAEPARSMNQMFDCNGEDKSSD